METGQLFVKRRDRVLLLTLSDLRTRNALHPGIYRAGIQAMDDSPEGPRDGQVADDVKSPMEPSGFIRWSF